ncbi:MAG: hypothetical protein NTW61_06785 [Candidatus Melainabacteria bacterium]|nr:hypothetical protein [Candidatus Melainabacteria bacterium]
MVFVHKLEYTYQQKQAIADNPISPSINPSKPFFYDARAFYIQT